MEEVKWNSTYKKDNIRLLRRHLSLTQKEFIQQYLTPEDGRPSMCVATFSNLESKGGSRLNEVTQTVAEKLQIDPTLFCLTPEKFADRLNSVLPNTKDTADISQPAAKAGNIDRLLYRLTMYFSEQLFDKRLKKGDKVESDRILAEKLGVGRSAIREALKVLDVLGMIDIRPGQGTFISNDEADFFIIPLSWSLFLNGGQIENILMVRNILEKKAAELTAEAGGEDCMEKLHGVSNRIHEAYLSQNFQDFLNCDMEFHLCIASGSGNSVIYSMIQTIGNLMKHISGTGMADQQQLQEIYEEHRLIYGAILSRDAIAAGKFMEEHLQKSMKRYNYR